MNGFLPQGHSAFEDPLTHLDWGAANIKVTPNTHRYFTSKNPMTQEQINRAEEWRYENAQIEDNEYD